MSIEDDLAYVGDDALTADIRQQIADHARMILAGERAQARLEERARRRAQDQQKRTQMAKLTPMEMGRLDKVRDDERARENFDREFWLTDLYPVQWPKERKLHESQKRAVALHAQHMLANGRLTPAEHRQFIAACAEDSLSNCSMEEFIALRRENPITGETLIDGIRKGQALDRTGDEREDKRRERDVANKIVADLGFQLTHNGNISEEAYGRLLRESGIVAPDLIDADGNVVISDGDLGAQAWLERAIPNTNFKAGDLYREDKAKAEAAAAKEDVNAHNPDGSSFFVSDKEAEQWKAQREHDVLASSPHGRDQLKRQDELRSEVSRLSAELETLVGPDSDTSDPTQS
jgi:hypothetical protein